jgi:hypothetical protein
VLNSVWDRLRPGAARECRSAVALPSLAPRGRDQEEEWSRDRGRKGHRILRRVLDGGRHFGSSRATLFHERVVTATSAASSRKKQETADARKGRGRRSAKARPTPAEEARGDRSVRGTIASLAPWEQHAHARYPDGSLDRADRRASRHMAVRYEHRSAEASGVS